MSNSVYTIKLNKPENEEEEPSNEAKQMAVNATIGLLGLILAPFGVWVAWNLCMPALFGLPVIGYVQSVGLYILSRALLK
ncbi:hypothetical protein BOW92_gp031 [Synechococcus phage S-WAM1]|jgi:hypothetical protein|uniref:Uncharacterized protein n=1 Tax=Synechococcus phage S-WAM1 TaxID=1815521 RepID=A0A1D8KSQ5_9CAUD|nr:hypothetical protein BOW92_gp031 [Synechococcus phage S-WAM1]AOV61686.1 hypothetical protein P090810_213 [Synechococcus phage S-WAM1]